MEVAIRWDGARGNVEVRILCALSKAGLKDGLTPQSSRTPPFPGFLEDSGEGPRSSS